VLNFSTGLNFLGFGWLTIFEGGIFMKERFEVYIFVFQREPLRPREK